MQQINSTKNTILFKIKISLWLIACLVFALASSTASSALAQETQPADSQDSLNLPSNAPLSLSVHPPVAYVAVKPSEKLKHTLIVKNHGTQELEISVNITDFKSDGRTGQPVLQPGRIFNREMNPDLQFGEQFTLAPGRSHSVNLQIDVSEVAPEKEYPLAIMINARGSRFGAAQSDELISSSSQVAGTLVSNLIVYIGDQESNQGKLEIAELQLPKIIDSFTGVRFGLLAANTGPTATLIHGGVKIHNIFRQQIAEYIFYPDFVLAETTRAVRGTKFSFELLDAEGFLKPEEIDTLYTQFHYKPPLMFGLYSVEIELGEEQRTQRVIAFPFSLVALAGLGWVMHWGWQQVVKKVR